MAVNLKIVQDTVSEEQRNNLLEDRDICGLCSTKFARYTCPKCNIRYCSLSCYKSQKHANCSEVFYKDWFMEELQQRRGSSKERAKMMEILKRLKETEDNHHDEGERDSEEEEIESLEQRIAGIDLDSDPDQIWERLTMEEKRQFQDMFHSGTLAELVVTTHPWWESIPAIEPMDSAVPKATPTTKTTPIFPPLPGKIPSLASLLKEKSVSSCLCYNVLNVLYAYIYTVRMFNSSLCDLPVQVAQTVLDISSVLSDNLSFTTTQDSLEHAIAIVESKPHLFNSRQYSLSMLHDIMILIQRTSMTGFLFASHALADVYEILHKAKKIIKSTTSNDNDNSMQLFLSSKKVLFLLSWCQERGPLDLPPLIPFMQLLQQQNLVGELNDRPSAAMRGQDNVKCSKPLIRELN